MAGNKDDTIEKDTEEETLTCNQPHIKFSLEFRCDYNTSTQRRLCQNFWDVIEQSPELDRIMVKGWSENAEMPKRIIHPSKELERKEVQLPCDVVKQLMDSHACTTMTKMMQRGKEDCLEDSSEDSAFQLEKDMKDFNARVVPLNCIPPRQTKSSTNDQEIEK